MITLLYENGIEAHGRLINIWSLLICQGTVLLSILSVKFLCTQAKCSINMDTSTVLWNTHSLKNHYV